MCPICARPPEAPKSKGPGPTRSPRPPGPFSWSGTPGSNRRPSPWQFGGPASTNLPAAPRAAQALNFIRDGVTAGSPDFPCPNAETRISGSNWGPRRSAQRRRGRASPRRLHRHDLQPLRTRRTRARPHPERNPLCPFGPRLLHREEPRPNLFLIGSHLGIGFFNERREDVGDGGGSQARHEQSLGIDECCADRYVHGLLDPAPSGATRAGRC